MVASTTPRAARERLMFLDAVRVLVFPEAPIWSNGVLQTLGLSILVAAPAALLLRSRAGRWGSLTPPR
jgi:hypothetical protein